MRIAIVNDLFMAVEAMRRALIGARQHEVAWVARDGAEAVTQCQTDKPDLILMDLIMPNMDGVEATRRIMASTPCPIVVVTASVASNQAKVFDALGAGALDALNTPVLEGPSGPEGAAALLAKIETIGKLVGGSAVKKPPLEAPQPAPLATLREDRLVVMGASAGGPGALAKILGTLPSNFAAPIVVVQHVDAQFAQGMADWLDHQSPLPVRLAREGDRPQPASVLLAGTDKHLVLASPTRLAYTNQPHDVAHSPSIDVFFKSVNRLWPGQVVAVLLTGMGRDGAEGLLDLRRSGHITIAQDEESCAVYGMPKAAAELRAASEILPLEKIGPRLAKLAETAASF
jgi:chemotaxis response regulator CheB